MNKLLKHRLIDRRGFLGGSLAAGLGTVPWMAKGNEAPFYDMWEVGAFEKIFQNLSYQQMGEKLGAMGFQGIEATVRPGGHIEPENVAEELPKAVEALGRSSLKVMVMATAINRANKQAEQLLKVAKSLGINRYRMGYYRYKEGRSPRLQVEEFKAQARDVAAMNRELGVQGVYQNHAGSNMVGAALWDLDLVLAGIPKAEIGVALDLRHAVIESGLSWKRGFALMRPRVSMIYVKDSVWRGNDPVKVPLGKGFVQEKVFQEAVKGLGKVPISLHVEYFGGKPLPVNKLGPAMAAHATDLKTLRAWMAKV